MNFGQGISVVEFIVNVIEEEIVWVFKEYGEECFVKWMVCVIVQCCQEWLFEWIVDFVEVIMVVNFVWEKGKNLVICVFQGLCIYVNNELGDFECGFDVVFELLVVGGWLVVISFYFLEDCIVKLFMCKYVKGEVDNLLCDLLICFKVFELCLKLLGKLQYVLEEEFKVNLCLCSVVMCVVEKLR